MTHKLQINHAKEEGPHCRLGADRILFRIWKGP